MVKGVLMKKLSVHQTDLSWKHVSGCVRGPGLAGPHFSKLGSFSYWAECSVQDPTYILRVKTQVRALPTCKCIDPFVLNTSDFAEPAIKMFRRGHDPCTSLFKRRFRSSPWAKNIVYAQPNAAPLHVTQNMIESTWVSRVTAHSLKPKRALLIACKARQPPSTDTFALLFVAKKAY